LRTQESGKAKILETESLEIKVVSLSKERKITDFSGAVGNFEIEAVVDKKDVRINETITL
jgi:hypothetical protein